MKLQEMFAAAKIAKYNKSLGKPMFLHEVFMEIRYTDNFKISTKVDGKNEGIAINPSNFDADPILREFKEVATYDEDKLYFKEAHKLNEQNRKRLFELLKMESNKALEVFVKQRFKEMAGEDGWLDSVRIRAEIMFIQLITSGKNAIKDKGLEKEVDYLHPTGNKALLSGAGMWTTVTGTPISDLLKWKKLNKANTEYAIMSRKTFENMVKTDEVKNYMKEEFKITLASDEEILTGIQRKTGLQIIIYEYEAKANEREAKKVIFPDDIVSLLPRKLGYISYGPTISGIDTELGLEVDDNMAIIPKTYATLTVTYEKSGQANKIRQIVFEIESTMSPDEPDMSNLVIAKTA